MTTITNIQYDAGRRVCEITMEVDHPRSLIRRALRLPCGRGEIEVFTMNYGRTWIDNTSVGTLGNSLHRDVRDAARKAYQWMPTREACR